MKETLAKAQFALTDDVVIGVPFGKSYYKPTPKFLRILGDVILFIGNSAGLLAMISYKPVFGSISVIFGLAFKYLSNCASYQDAIAPAKVLEQVITPDMMITCCKDVIERDIGETDVTGDK